MTDLASASVPIPGDALALRPRSVGELLDAGFTLYRRHFGTLALVMLICEALPAIVGLYLATAGTTGAPSALGLANLLLRLVLSAIATGATVFIISESYLGRRLSAGTALERAKPLVGRIIAAMFLKGILIFFGFILFIVPGFVAMCGLLLTTPVIVLEPHQSASAALSRSWELTKGAKWRIFGLLFTAMILLMVPIMAVQGVVAALILPGIVKGGLPQATAATQAMAAILAAFVALVSIFVLPLLSCLWTVAYYDMRVRKEGFDLEVLAASLHSA